MDLKLQTSYRQILGMALPISMAMLVPQINFITNNIFLGALGEKELASAGITGVYYLIFAVIGNGLNNGMQALISRRAGQDRPKEIGTLFVHGIWVALAMAAMGIALTYLLAPSILDATIHDAGIAKQCIDFLLIRIWGLPLFYLYVMRNALLVGTNQTKLLIWGTLAEAMANIFFVYGLIYGHFGMPQLGFNGAAYASIIAEGTGLLVIYAVIRIKGIHKSFGFFEESKFNPSTIKLILIQSSPLILQYAISVISWEYFYILIEHHGPRALAISNTMRIIFGLFGIFSWSFASTTNSMVSNIIGQGRQSEVIPLIHRIVRVSFSISLVLFVLLTMWPEWFLSFYGQGDDFIRDAIPVVRIVSVALLIMSFSTVWLNAVTGTGKTKMNLLIEVAAIVFYSLYIYLVMIRWKLSLAIAWTNEIVYWAVIFSIAFWYIKSGKWKRARL